MVGPFKLRFTMPAHYLGKTSLSLFIFFDEFRSACHKHYFSYWHAVGGMRYQHQRMKEIMNPSARNNMVTTGSAFPNAQQKPGNSTIGQIRQGGVTREHR